ncbi:MAG TPA: hypothetical protein VFN02_02145, partial [Ktedonobacteraceae bacterium]|nr:hypothetical protein [Ktedonobacteraceae bacterium]
VATAYARKFLGLDAEGMGQTLHQLFGQLLGTGRVLMTLPGSLQQLISRLEAGQIEVKLASPLVPARPGTRKGRHYISRSEWPKCSGTPCGYQAFMFVASLAGGIFLLVEAHLCIPGWFCLGLAGLTILGALVKS